MDPRSEAIRPCATSVDSCIGSPIGIPAQRAHSSICPILWIGFRVTDWHLLTSLFDKDSALRECPKHRYSYFYYFAIVRLHYTWKDQPRPVEFYMPTPHPECFSSAQHPIVALAPADLHIFLPPCAIDSLLARFYPTGAMLPPVTNLEAPKWPNPNLTSLESTKMLQTLKVSISFPIIFCDSEGLAKLKRYLRGYLITEMIVRVSHDLQVWTK